MVYKPSNKVLSRNILIHAFEQNDDGAGFAYAKNNRLIVRKGFTNFKSFWNAFNQVQQDNPAVIHFRRASSGSKNAENCHPFAINKNVCVAHNGVLEDWIPTKENDRSDTRWFVQVILQPMLKELPEAYLSTTFQFLLEKAIGNGNKLIFLDSKGQHAIIRKHAGVTVKGCWFSNESYKTSRNTVTTFDHAYTEWVKKEGKRLPFHLQQQKQKKFKPNNQTERILGGPSQLGKIHSEETAQFIHDMIPFEQNDGNRFRKIIEMQDSGMLGSGDFRRVMS